MEIDPPHKLGLGFRIFQKKIKRKTLDQNIYLKQLKIRFLFRFSNQLHVIHGS